MSANQRKIAVLQNLLDRVQTRAASPRVGRVAQATAAVAMVASAPVEAAAPASEVELTPLVTDAALLVADAAELTPSEEIVVVDLTPSPQAPELEIVVEDELASGAALIEALSSDDEEEAPASSHSRPPHHLEAAMAPMTMDPISDRPTARITLPPESGPQLSTTTELAPAGVPTFDPPSEPDDLEPEITISSEPAEMIFGDEPSMEQLGGLVDLDEPAEALSLELAPPESEERPEPAARNEMEADLGSEVGAGVYDPALPPPVEAAEELAAQDRRLSEERAEPVLVLEEVDGDEAELLAEAEVALPPLPKDEPVLAAVVIAPEPSPPPLPSEPPVAPPAPVSVELAAEVVRPTPPAEAQVAAIVGAAESFAPKTFGELLDASLKL